MHQALTFVHLHVSGRVLDDLDFLIRKLAHLSNYTILAAFLYQAFSGDSRLAWNRKHAFVCVLAASLYSLTDELHQIFVPGRTPALHDCAIDTAGALLGITIVYLDRRFFPRSVRNRARQQAAVTSD